MEEGSDEIIGEDKSNLGNNKSNKSNFFKDWVVPLVIAFVLAFLIKQYILFKVYIPSGSMIPTLNVGDHLFVTKVYNLDNIERGDILVFDSKELNDLLIKRVIGLPGDDITIVNGQISVNGEEVQEDYTINKDNYYGEFHVPEGKYFFCGDNRPDSYDSRKWANPYINGEDIQAKAQVKVYPFSDFGSIK